MLLTEFQRPESIKQASERLAKAGWSQIGKGVNGYVFKKPGVHHVLKLFDARDTAYLDFIKLAIKNQSNPSFPRVHRSVVKITDKFFAVRTEPLSGDLSSKPDLYDTVLDYFELHTGDVESEDIEIDPEEFEQKNKSLADALKLIAQELVKKKGHLNDLTEQNVMFRGSTPVIIDPVSPSR